MSITDLTGLILTSKVYLLNFVEIARESQFNSFLFSSFHFSYIFFSPFVHSFANNIRYFLCFHLKWQQVNCLDVCVFCFSLSLQFTNDFSLNKMLENSWFNFIFIRKVFFFLLIDRCKPHMFQQPFISVFLMCNNRRIFWFFKQIYYKTVSTRWNVTLFQLHGCLSFFVECFW